MVLFEKIRDGLSNVKNLRMVVLAGLITAVSIVSKSMFFTVGENLRVYFSYIAVMVGCYIYGPILGLFVGFASDILGHFLFPSGEYFFGYTLSAMLSGFVYGIFLYKSRISFWRVLFAKAFVNVFINICLGSLWSKIITGKAYLYFLYKSVAKNLILLPIEAIIAFTVLVSLSKYLSKSGVLFKSKVNVTKV